jgi:hypothetical protein
MGSRLPPGEAERRRKERSRRSFTDEAYEHYDARDGFGSSEEWKRAAGERQGIEPVVLLDRDLEVLGLAEMPETRKLLHAAYRNASRAAHPDAGGSHEAFIAMTLAYENLRDRIIT